MTTDLTSIAEVPDPGAGLPPLPELTELNSFYWEATRNHRLDLLRCRRCGHFVHYPRPMCDHCQSTDLAPQTISGRGRLYSWCTVVQPGHPYFEDKVPYEIGVVDIVEEEGIRIPAGIVNDQGLPLRCGMDMEVVFRELTAAFTLPFFRPVGEVA